MKCSHEDFVKAWLSSNNHKEIAAKTGLSLGAVNQRQRQLRDLGVDLPPFRGRNGKPDVNALNALIKEAT